MNDSNAAGATIDRNGEEAIVQGVGLLQNTTDIGDIVLRTSTGGALYVRDVAKITTAPMPRLGGVTRDGKGQAVIGVVLMGLGQNTRVVAGRISSAVQAINKTLPPGVTIAPYYNRADLINRVLGTAAHNLAEGAILVIVVLFLLLGNARAGLIVAVAIPLSMLAAACAMYAAGLSGNLMSLGAIDFGLLVDGAVVMIENVVRRRAEEPNRPVGLVVREAAREVARPVTFAVIIITAVYLPILSLQGIEGKMFRPMALTVIFALLASLVLTLTLMPVLSSLLLRGKITERESLIVQNARRIYGPALNLTPKRPAITLGLAACLLVAAGLVGSNLSSEFLPNLDEGSLTVTTTKLPGISLTSALQTQEMVERTLMKFPEVQTTVTLGGSSEIPTDPMGSGDIFIILKPKSEWKTAQTQAGLVAAYSKALNEDVPGITQDWAQPIEMRMDGMLQGVQADVAIMIHGDNLNTLPNIANQVANLVSRVPGAADVEAEQTIGQPYLRIVADRAAVARYGLNVRDGGQTVGTIDDGVGRFDIRVRLAPQDRDNMADIGNLRVSNGAGISVPLSEVASSPPSIPGLPARRKARAAQSRHIRRPSSPWCKLRRCASAIRLRSFNRWAVAGGTARTQQLSPVRRWRAIDPPKAVPNHFCNSFFYKCLKETTVANNEIAQSHRAHPCRSCHQHMRHITGPGRRCFCQTRWRGRRSRDGSRLHAGIYR